tara:strand:- start:800 stop:1315 length:516 start_codon:yes stop_codon:yes gene_type:complete
MTIILKNKETLIFNEFKFKCSIGKKGLTKNKKEGDKKTPIGTFSLGNLFYRNDRNIKPLTKLKCVKIQKDMGWCNDVRSNKYYNKLVRNNKTVKNESLYRRDYKYDFMVPINYNTKNTQLGKGSAIFLHLSNNLKPTLGCIALNKKDFLILVKLIDKNTKIKILHPLTEYT